MFMRSSKRIWLISRMHGERAAEVDVTCYCILTEVEGLAPLVGHAASDRFNARLVTFSSMAVPL